MSDLHQVPRNDRVHCRVQENWAWYALSYCCRKQGLPDFFSLCFFCYFEWDSFQSIKGPPDWEVTTLTPQHFAEFFSGLFLKYIVFVQAKCTGFKINKWVEEVGSSLFSQLLIAVYVLVWIHIFGFGFEWLWEGVVMFFLVAFCSRESFLGSANKSLTSWWTEIVFCLLDFAVCLPLLVHSLFITLCSVS